MNHRLVLRQIALLACVLGTLELLLGGWAQGLLLMGEGNEVASRAAFLVSGLGSLLIAAPLLLLSRGAPPRLARRAALLLLTSSWVMASVLAAVPFGLWALWNGDADHPFRDPVNCLFEATSGLTTTGSSVLSDIEALPHTLLFWRSLLHWLGGIGVVVLFVTVLPTVQAGSRALAGFESSGKGSKDVLPRIRSAARGLLVIYVGLTLANTAALMACGLGWFDAVCHAFGTVATGGFSTKNASIGAFNSPAVLWVTIGFMVLSSLNFGLLMASLTGRWRDTIRDPEMRVFLCILALGTLVVSLVIAGEPLTTTSGDLIAPTAFETVTNGSFTTISLATTAGFCTVDYDTWPFVAHATIVALIFVGGCAGSTAGGIKAVRLWITLKLLGRQLELTFRPELARPVHVGSRTLASEDEQEAVHFVITTLLILAVGGCLLMIVDHSRGMDFTTAMTACLASFSTTGPGLGRAGALYNYWWMSDTTKLILCGIMLLGRLEIFPLLAIFLPRFWRA